MCVCHNINEYTIIKLTKLERQVQMAVPKDIIIVGLHKKHLMSTLLLLHIAATSCNLGE